MPNQNVPLYIPDWYRKLQADPAAMADYQRRLRDAETQPIAVPMLPLPAPTADMLDTLDGMVVTAIECEDDYPPAMLTDLRVWIAAVRRVVAR